jgi:predicted AAA+ superfamily ATPase
LPFSLSELEERPSLSLKGLGKRLPGSRESKGADLMQTVFCGFYPRIHDRGLPPQQWLANYSQTYLERDVRELLNVGDLETFGRFLRLCAGRTGQLLNLSSLANDCGITHTTSRRWLSVLEASFLLVLHRPHHKNFSKRLVKSPKIHFLDTGLLCYLLRIRSPEDLRIHAQRGSIFESFVISELLKNYLHQGLELDLYFWRDSTGHEIDVLIDRGKELIPVEIKSGETITADFFTDLRFWKELTGSPDASAALVYGGDQALRRSGVIVYPWRML